MSDLPDFQSRPRDQVYTFISRILTLPGGNQTHLHELMGYGDGHYRAVFSPSYFVLPEGQTQPSKSQWSSLKKRIKRHDSRAFIFKEHGEMPVNGQRFCYIDFGFFME